MKTMYRRFFPSQLSPLWLSHISSFDDIASGNLCLATGKDPHHSSHTSKECVCGKLCTAVAPRWPSEPLTLQCLSGQVGVGSQEVCSKLLLEGMSCEWPLLHAGQLDFVDHKGVGDRNIHQMLEHSGGPPLLWWTECVPIIWSEVSTPLIYLLYSMIAVGLGTEIFCFIPSSIFCQRSTVSPLYTGWMVEHRESSRVSIH